MTELIRNYVSPLAAVMTLAIGIGFVMAVSAVSSIFTRPTTGPSPTSEPTQSMHHDFIADAPTPQPPPETTEIEKQSKLICTDSTLRPVWNRLFKDFLADGVPDRLKNASCTDFFEMKRIDLDGDGKLDLLVRGKESPICMYNGNCAFIVFRNVRGRYRPVLGVIDYWEATGQLGKQVKLQRTNGFRDLTVAEHLNVSDTMYTTYKFHKEGYKEASCKINAYVRGTSPKERWEMISCREYERRGY